MPSSEVKADYRLKRRLLDFSMTQRELAHQLGRPEQWLSMVARDNHVPLFEDRRRIAALLDCEVKDLWPGLPTGHR